MWTKTWMEPVQMDAPREGQQRPSEGHETGRCTRRRLARALAGLWLAGVAMSCGGLPPVDDQDGDGVPDAQDNCPSIPNPDQADGNANGVGDACDLPPTPPRPVPPTPPEPLPPTPPRPVPPALDSDGDGVADAIDNCPTTPNPDQTDMDQDGRGDRCEAPARVPPPVQPQ